MRHFEVMMVFIQITLYTMRYYRCKIRIVASCRFVVLWLLGWLGLFSSRFALLDRWFKMAKIFCLFTFSFNFWHDTPNFKGVRSESAKHQNYRVRMDRCVLGSVDWAVWYWFQLVQNSTGITASYTQFWNSIWWLKSEMATIKLYSSMK